VDANRCFAHSPIGTLIDLVVWSGLCCQIPVRLDRNPGVDRETAVLVAMGPVTA